MPPALLRLETLSATPLDIALHAPFGISGGAQDVARNVLVAVTLADGTVGYGEAAPLPAYIGETQAQAQSVLVAGKAAVEGQDGRDWRAVAARFRAAGGGACGSAQAGFELALLDALAARRGVDETCPVSTGEGRDVSS